MSVARDARTWMVIGDRQFVVEQRRCAARGAVVAVIFRLVGLSTVVSLMVGLGRMWVVSSGDSTCKQHCTQLGKVMNEWIAKHKHFPAASITGKNDKPLLSWRVAILPELGYGALYSRFHLDEPWDSPHNHALLAEMPAEFSCPRCSAQPFETTYRVIVGPLTLFEPMADPTTIDDVTDGTSNTLMIVEARDAVPWTKPDELTYVPEDITSNRAPVLPTLGDLHKEGSYAVFADGMVRLLKRTIIPSDLHAIITRNGGEVISSS